MAAVRSSRELRRAQDYGPDAASPRTPPLSAGNWGNAVLVLILAVAAALRVMAMVAYSPALFFSDSWGYVSSAFGGHPVRLSYLRPNGYSVLIRILTFPGRNLNELIALQHLAGLALGVLIYAALVRAATPRLLALAAAALVLLDGYWITLEQYVMPEAFFALTLLVAALLLAWPRLSGAGKTAAAAAPLRTTRPAAPRIHPPAAAGAGLLVAASIIQREAALFAIPAFLVYLAWARVGLRAMLAFLIALGLPVLGYAAIYQAKMGTFSLTESDGWALYGRVAGFADCGADGVPAAQRPLCETGRQQAQHPDAPTWYIWNGASPADRLFHGGHQTRQAQEHANRILGSFARRVIVQQPLQYADAAASDFVRFFEPGAVAFEDAVSATTLPSTASREWKSESVRHRYLPHVHPSVSSPAGFLRAYRSVIHVPRPILALLAIASVLALALRTPARREVLLLSGAGLLMLIGTSATAGFGLRYLLPSVPLLAIGGALAVSDLIGRVKRRQDRPT